MAQVNLIGQEILGYRVVKELGAGAFGTVYKVVKTNAAGQYVRALKHITLPTEKQYYAILNSMGGDISKVDNYFVKMLKSIVSEINILNDLSEKGGQYIVRYYENDIRETASPKRYDIYILMEYLTPLEEYMQNKEVCVRDVIKLGKNVLTGLKTCHDNGIIHRDIKDDNIFVSEQGEYKIGDFGVSKLLKDSSKAESLKGTPNFLAPEVYLGREGYKKSVDLYSLGIVLYRLLNYNRNPFLPHYPEMFDECDENIAFEKRMKGEIPDLPSLGGRYIGLVIVKALLNRNERYQTAEEFLRAIEFAEENTPLEFLEEKIRFHHAGSVTGSKDLHISGYKETLGEEYSIESEEVEKKYNSSINKHLFESVGEAPIYEEIEEDKESTSNVRQNMGINQISVQSGAGTKFGKSKMWLIRGILTVLVLLVMIGAFAKKSIQRDIEPSNVPDDEGVQQELEVEETIQTEETPSEANKRMRIKEVVGIRAERSTESERLANAYPNEFVTVIENYSDGWSKVDYYGTVGYCKTEFLELYGSLDAQENNSKEKGNVRDFYYGGSMDNCTSSVESNPLTFKIADFSYEILTDVTQDDMPIGFTIGDWEYHGVAVKAGFTENSNMVCILAREEETSYIYRFIYDQNSNLIVPYFGMQIKDGFIYTIPIHESAKIPDGFAESYFVIQTVPMFVYISESIKLTQEEIAVGALREGRSVVFLMMNNKGEEVYYNYDLAERTFQRAYFE